MRPARSSKNEPSLAVVALAFAFCMPLGLLLAFHHSAFRSEDGKLDPLFIAAVVALGLILIYAIVIAAMGS
jgi:hypothetical protein